MWMRVNRTAFGDPVHSDFDVAVGADREFILADLIAFGQVGIKVIFARENGSTARFRSGSPSPARMANSTTFLFNTGKTPGTP